MNCREFQERITAAVDHCLEDADMDSFLDHAAKCPRCLYEFRLESTTKSIVRARVRMVKTPPDLSAAIAHQLAEDDFRATPVSDPLWRRLWRIPLVKAGLGFALAMLAIVLIMRPPSGETQEAGNGDVIVQSRANFHAVLSGAIRPQLRSNRPELVQDFFTGKTEFPVHILQMKECALVGGVLSEHDGVRLAHVVYRHGDETIYVYQACWKTVLQGNKLRLSGHVTRELERSGWFSDSGLDGNTIVLWTTGETLCAAVANLSKEELIAYLPPLAPPRTIP